MLAGFFQFEPVFGVVSNNLDTIEEAADRESFDLLVLPELCTTGYQFVSQKEVRDLSEPVPGGPSTDRLIKIAKKSNAHIVAGLAEKDGKDIFNTAVMVNGSGMVSKYRKIHLFHEETLWFTPGSELPDVVDIGSARVGMIICFDWFFPELTRILTIAGADIVVQPANLILPYCQKAMQTRSIENRIFTITANRTGIEERGGKKPLTFTGGSQVTDVKGNVLISASANDEKLQVVEIDPEQARDKSITPYNSLMDSRRPDIYADLLGKK